LELIKTRRIWDDIDIDPEDIVCRLASGVLIRESVTGFAVELLVESEASTVVAEISLDPFECRCNWRCLEICNRLLGIDMDAEIDIPRPDVWASVWVLKAGRHVQMDRPPAEQTRWRLSDSDDVLEFRFGEPCDSLGILAPVSVTHRSLRDAWL
jgi:hypothetical protein